ncbi:MAG: trehalose-6-phosphate synthase [Pseudomonadota bacterium]
MRAVIVSNRLPVSLHQGETNWEVRPSSGGLVKALAGFRGKLEFAWAGGPGACVPEDEQEAVRSLPEKEHAFTPVFLDAAQIEHFYDAFRDSVSWSFFQWTRQRVFH